jgi:3-isopropylmalate/(R)-2-methylmalate dehydratase small subunit
VREIRGRAFVFGDNVDTDQIYPGRYLELTEHREIAGHAMEGVDPSFAERVEPGDVVVAGVNFGCGSSREHAVITLKVAGVGAVVARSFARIFYRNAVNQGLPVVEVPDLEPSDIEPGGEVAVDLEAGILNHAGKVWRFTPLPASVMEIIDAGGVFRLYSRRAEEGRPAREPSGSR